MELSKLLKTAAIASALTLASAASQALLLQPSNADYDGTDGSGSYGPSNCEPDCINDLFSTSFTNDSGLLYKSDFDDGAESGDYADSYDMTWYNELDEEGKLEPYGGLLSWLADTPHIVCGDCYVAVKDGNISPRYYFFDISALWDGKADLEFDNFWKDGKGAISHISIWGSPAVEVPEPGTLGLLGLGLMGFVAFRKKRAS